MSNLDDFNRLESSDVPPTLDDKEGSIDGKTSKLEALRTLLRSYFARFPRVSIKALSERSGVPYATLRRILQSEVNQIKDETIFKLLERVTSRREQLGFFRDHYPSLEKMLEIMRNAEISSDEAVHLYKKFCRMNPHNLLLKLALTSKGTTRQVVERLTGDCGLAALNEMIASGFLVEDQKSIRSNNHSTVDLSLSEIRDQIVLDVQRLSCDVKPELGFITHTFEAVTPEAFARIIAMSRQLLKEVEGIKATEVGSVPFFFDLVIGTYDTNSMSQLLPDVDREGRLEERD